MAETATPSGARPTGFFHAQLQTALQEKYKQ